MGRIHEQHFLKASKGKCVSCCHLGQQIIVKAINRPKKLERKEAGKGVTWGSKDYEKLWHIAGNLEAHAQLGQNTVSEKTTEDPKISHLAELKGLNKKKVKARAES